tara:strand:- start:287 stop:754 length:468 start_codon:yes stop_codon:yes gene_type:complete
MSTKISQSSIPFEALISSPIIACYEATNSSTLNYINKLDDFFIGNLFDPNTNTEPINISFTNNSQKITLPLLTIINVSGGFSVDTLKFDFSTRLTSASTEEVSNDYIGLNTSPNFSVGSKFNSLSNTGYDIHIECNAQKQCEILNLITHKLTESI